MIDWFSVGFGALWILGLGFVLATLSFANYLASAQKRRLRQSLGMPTSQLVIYLGLALFCLGWVESTPALWERLLWIVLALMFAAQAWQARKMSNE